MTRLDAIPWAALPVLVPLGAAALVLVVRARAVVVWIALSGALLALGSGLALAWLHPADRLAAFAAPLAGCAGVAIALAMPGWIAREIDGFRLAAAHVPRVLAAGQGLLAATMLAVVAPDPATGWLGLVGMNLALLLPLALADEPAVRLRGRALLGLAAIGLAVALFGAVARAAPGADGVLAWLGAACLLLGGTVCGALAFLAGREATTPAGGLSGLAVVLAVLVLALRQPAAGLVAALGVAMVLAGAAWAAWVKAAEDWVDAATLAQSGLVLAAAGQGTPAARFAALVQLALLVLARVVARPDAGGMLALAGLPPFGLLAGIYLGLSVISATSVPLAVVLAVALLVPLWRLPRVLPPLKWDGWRDLPGWAVLALGGVLGLAMPAPLAGWIGRVAAEWP